MAARKPNVPDRDLSVAEQKSQAAGEAGASVETESEDTATLPPPANDGVGNGSDSDGESKPASLSMAAESDVSGDADRAKDRAELRNLRAERDNYKRQFDEVVKENRELKVMLQGAALAGSGKQLPL